MKLSSDTKEYWQRVEHDMKIASPNLCLLFSALLKGGILLTLLGAAHILLSTILTPAKGYFFSRLETVVHPFFWALIGVIMIIIGAILRYRAMGPIIQKIENDSN
ncbi:MAG: hypothetical protein OQK24_06120 [Magnetovibrio sp.]|nr:hypothetical protein [Magnetovibrio sp.]